MSNKTLQLSMVNKVYTNTKENRTIDYVSFVVNVNGLEIALKPADATAKKILTNYFRS